MKMALRTRYILLALGMLILGFIAWYFKDIVTYIIVAAVVSTLGRPLARFLRKVRIWKIRFNSSVSAFITLFLILVILLGMLGFIIPLVAGEFTKLASVDYNALLLQLEGPVNQGLVFIGYEPVTFSNFSVTDLASSKLASLFKFSKVTDLFGSVAGTIGSIFVGIFSTAFIAFFFLKEEGMFREGLMALTPEGYEDRFSRSFDRITNLLNRYFIGLVIEIIIVAILVTIGLLIVGLNFGTAALIGVLCGLFNVIPYLGPWIGGGFGIVIALPMNVDQPFMSHTLPVLGFMIIVFGSSQMIDNILIQPLIYSSSVKAHPLEIFLVIMAAGSIAGILGMILAIPVYTILRVLASEFLSNLKVVRKLTENMEPGGNVGVRDLPK